MRFPILDPERMSPAQKGAYDATVSGPRGGARGPFNVLLRSPELADRVQKVGEYLRFNSSLPARLNEFAILVNARFWESTYEWYAHRPLAVKAGLAESIADDLARNRRPAGMKADEELVYEFCTSLHRRHFVEDPLFERARATFGEQGWSISSASAATTRWCRWSSTSPRSRCRRASRPPGDGRRAAIFPHSGTR